MLTTAGLTFFARPEKLSGGCAAVATPLQINRDAVATPNPKVRRAGDRALATVFDMFLSIVF
jgi:hypothetical protein